MSKVSLDEGLARTHHMVSRYQVNGDTIRRWTKHKKHPLPAIEINEQFAFPWDAVLKMEGYEGAVGARREALKMKRPLLPIQVARLLGYSKKDGEPNVVTAQRAMRRSVRWREKQILAGTFTLKDPPDWYIPSFVVGGSYYANRDRVFNLAKIVSVFGAVPSPDDPDLEVA
jgi:hypothetical protein